MQDEAIAEAQKLNPDLARFYQRLKEGNESEAKEVLSSLPDNDRLLSVTRQLLAGDEEGVMNRLERAFDERNPQLVVTLAGPEFDLLDANPRYQNLLQRMNLRQ
jgi:hypothetical protein